MKKLVMLMFVSLLATPLLSYGQSVVYLGSTTVSNDAKKTGLNIPNTCGIGKIRIKNYSSPTRLKAVVVKYQAAHAKDTRIPFHITLRKGDRTSWIDLPGNLRCIDKLVIIGESLGSKAQSLVHIEGLDTRVKLGQAVLSKSNSPKYVNVANVCGIEKVKIFVRKASANIDFLAVRFVATGKFQQIPVREFFQQGTGSQWKDLNGNKRCIDAFYIVGESAGRNKAEVSLMGLK